LVNRNKGQRSAFFCDNRRRRFRGCGCGFLAPAAGKCGDSQAQGDSNSVAPMADVLNLVMLVAASIGAMAFGILAAYGILRVGFALMRPREQRVVVKARAQAARVA
jgi:hypothetical protein